MTPKPGPPRIAGSPHSPFILVITTELPSLARLCLWKAKVPPLPAVLGVLPPPGMLAQPHSLATAPSFIKESLINVML